MAKSTGLVGLYLHLQSGDRDLGDNLTNVEVEISPGLFIARTVDTETGAPKGPRTLTSLDSRSVDKLEHASIAVVVFDSPDEYQRFRAEQG